MFSILILPFYIVYYAINASVADVFYVILLIACYFTFFSMYYILHN